MEVDQSVKQICEALDLLPFFAFMRLRTQGKDKMVSGIITGCFTGFAAKFSVQYLRKLKLF